MKPSEKDKYQLWWEYLKLSENYKKYCEKPLVHRLYMLKLKTSSPQLIEKKEKIHQMLYGTAGLPDVYDTFGDVFNDSFVDFWKKKGKQLKKSLRFPRVIIEDVENITDSISSFYELMTPITKQSYSKFKEIIRESLSNSSTNSLENV